MITEHGFDRAKERFGFAKKYATSFISNGIVRGKGGADFKGDEREWLEKHSHNGCNAVAYNGACLIVSPEKVCITVFELPAWFGKKRQFDRNNKRVRNMARYHRMWCMV